MRSADDILLDIISVIEHPEMISVVSGDCNHISNPGSPLHLNTGESWLTIHTCERPRHKNIAKADKLKAAIAEALLLCGGNE